MRQMLPSKSVRSIVTISFIVFGMVYFINAVQAQIETGKLGKNVGQVGVVLIVLQNYF